MSRGDLIEIIYQYQRREQEQALQIEELTSQVNERMTRIENAGSIAEAALSVNHVFEAAQAAADQFLAELREANSDKDDHGRRILAEARAEAEALRQKTQAECKTMVDEAKRECDAMYTQINQLLKNYEQLRSASPSQSGSR